MQPFHVSSSSGGAAAGSLHFLASLAANRSSVRKVTAPADDHSDGPPAMELSADLGRLLDIPRRDARDAMTLPPTTPTTPDPTVATVAAAGPTAGSWRRAVTLRRLVAFEKAALARLPQVAKPRYDDLKEFMAGKIEFRNVQDAALAFPCASGVRGTGFDSRVAIYPSLPGSAVRLGPARVGDEDVIVMRGHTSHDVLTSAACRPWETSEAYTDDAIEVLKLQMWVRILARVEPVLKLTRKRTLWMPWGR